MSDGGRRRGERRSGPRVYYPECCMTVGTTIMSEVDEHERKIVNEFCHLLEKSKQLFNGLRDLPQYGHKQWQAYFGRTFDIYTKLWKFQQQHRQILDTKYGLKRWQIGEIASKIGQLYYHYYLRTSETNYLNEAFSFYSAIRMRAYYSKANKEDSYLDSSHKHYKRPDLMVKKLRYYARFIVVCLLLKKMKLVRDLVRELAKQIDDYTATYEPEDQLEWSLVLGEIKSFIEADNLVNVVDVDSSSIILSHRLTPLNTPPIEKGTPVYLTLQEILIVGNCQDQVKFSELTLDMFRMLQALEREPQEDLTNQIYDTSPAPGRTPFTSDVLSSDNSQSFMCKTKSTDSNFPSRSASKESAKLYMKENGEKPTKRENPHKYLLYKPTFSQLLVFLASGFRELPPGGALLLYVSADGSFSSMKHPEDSSYDFGGVATNGKREDFHYVHSNKRPGNLKDMHCLHPGDLYAFTRKPVFVIVDSDNCNVFKSMPNLFGQPLVVLMAPDDIPASLQEQQHKGNLFTLFLHSPLTAFCFICNIVDIPIGLWDKCQAQVDKVITEAGRLMTRSRNLDHSYMQFYGDDFLRLLLLRFVFCSITLRLHRGFKGPSYYPKSHPPIPETEVLEHQNLERLALELASLLEVRSLFLESGEAD